MLDFLKSMENIVPRLLKHLKTASIIDIIMKLISLDDLMDGEGIVDVFIDFFLIGKSGWLIKD